MPAASQTRIGAPTRPGHRATRLSHGTTTSPQVAAVLALQRSAGNRATRTLMRQPTRTVPAPMPAEDGAPAPAPPAKIVGYGADHDVATVTMSDGTRWKVTRKRSTTPIVKKRGTFGVGVGGDADRIWLKASWCRGTRGEIRVGGNPQGAAKDVLKKLAQEIANGGDAEAVKQAITGAEIQPFIDWDIQRPGDWKITGDVTLTLDKGGFKKIEGKIGVEKGPFGGSVGGEVDRDGGWTITVKGEVKLGDKPKTKEACPADELLFPYEYSCELERDVPATVKRTPMSKDERFPEHRFVYFKYASDEINPQLTTKDDLKALEDLMAAGYKVTNVQAFTSPEGLRDPSPRWEEGNRNLSTRRADAAMHVAAERCLDGGCITGNISPPKDAELLPLDFENLEHPPSEASGKALEDHVIQAWNDGTSEDIREQKTPAADKRVKAARGRRAKAEVIYQYLRRSRIDLEKVVTSTWVEEEKVPAHVDRKAGNCPADVLEAARNAWRAGGLGN